MAPRDSSRGATPRKALGLEQDELLLQPSSAGRARKTATRSSARASPYARTPTKQVTRTDLATPTRTSSPGMLSELISIISPFRTFSRARQSAAFGGSEAEQEHSVQQTAAKERKDDIEMQSEPADESIEDLESGSDQGAAQEEEQNAAGTSSSSTSKSTLTVPTSAPFAASPGRFMPRLFDSVEAGPSLRSRASPRASAPLPQLHVPPSILAGSTSAHPFTPQEPPRQRATRYSSQFDLASSMSAAPLHGRVGPDSSPVSRNYDLLSRFFAEKRREESLGGESSGLTEVEVEGCLKLIEESMAAGRDLAHEFGHGPSRTTGFADPGRRYQVAETPASSRASSIAPMTALPTSQSAYTGLFHPGASARASGAFSFLAPRSSSTTSLASSAAARRHRPLYLGPGMGSQLSRRRTLAPSNKSLADSLAQSRRGWLPQSSSDTSLVDAARGRQQQQQQDQRQEKDDLIRPEGVKRRRTEAVDRDTVKSIASQQNARFETLFESQRSQSSELAKETTSVSDPSRNGLDSSLKRPAPSSSTGEGFVNGVRPAQNSTPVRAATRTATAVLDILKDSPPVKSAVQTDLVNPYQTSSSTLAKLPKKSKVQTPSKAARASMTTRARAREAAAAVTDDKDGPTKKESILDIIERTAPKDRSRRSRGISNIPEVTTTNEKPASLPPTASETNSLNDAEARKAEKTEEARRRLAALSKSREADKKLEQSVPATAPDTASAASTGSSTTSPSFSFGSGSNGTTSSPQKGSASSGFSFGGAQKPAGTLAPQLPPQYTASKPKKPSPLSATFQAPDSPSSASEKSQTNSPVPASKANPFKPAQPSYTFGVSTASNAAVAPQKQDAPKAAPFSFSSPASNQDAPKAAPFSFSSPASNQDAPKAAPFSFSSPASSADTPSASTSATTASAAASSSTLAFSFSKPASPVAHPATKEPTSATSTSKAIASPTSSPDPKQEALDAPVGSLPTFSFAFSAPSPASTGNGVSDKDAEAIKQEVLSLAASTLPKFDFVFGASAVTTTSENSTTKEEDKKAETAAPTPFSFTSATAGSGPTSSFSFKPAVAPPPATKAAAAPSVGFSFSPVTSGATTPTSILSGATTPVSLATLPAEGDAESEKAGSDGAGGSSNGLLGEGEGEEDEVQIYEVRAKFWRFDQEEKKWKDLGIGIAKLKKHQETSKRRMLVRNEANGKVVVNFNIYSALKPTQEKNVVSFLGFDGSAPCQLRCKIKTEEGARTFKEAIEKQVNEL